MVFSPFTIAFTVVACVLAIGYALFVELRAQVVDLLPVAPHHEARLIELDRQAIERAYVQQVTFLFQQWMKDQLDQPERAVRGAQQARKAYSDAMSSIEKRERELQPQPK